MVAPEHKALCFHQAENSLTVMAYLPGGDVRARARMPVIHVQDGHCHGCTSLGSSCHGAIGGTSDAKKGACGDRSLSRPDRSLPILGRIMVWIKKETRKAAHRMADGDIQTRTRRCGSRGYSKKIHVRRHARKTEAKENKKFQKWVDANVKGKTRSI